MLYAEQPVVSQLSSVVMISISIMTLIITPDESRLATGLWLLHPPGQPQQRVGISCSMHQKSLNPHNPIGSDAASAHFVARWLGGSATWLGGEG